MYLQVSAFSEIMELREEQLPGQVMGREIKKVCLCPPKKHRTELSLYKQRSLATKATQNPDLIAVQISPGRAFIPKVRLLPM